MAISRSFIIAVLNFSPHSPYNIRTLLDDLHGVDGEVICVFNGHEPFDELRDHPRIDKWCLNRQNAGVARSWNIGLQLAEGTAAFVLNADVHVKPAAIEGVEKYLFALDRAMIVGPHGSLINYRQLKASRLFSKGTFTTPVQTDDVSGFFFAIHMERFRQHNLVFDVRFSPCFFEEWDMGLQVRAAGGACYAVPVVDFDHRMGVSASSPTARLDYFGRSYELDEIFQTNCQKFMAKWDIKVIEKLIGRTP